MYLLGGNGDLYGIQKCLTKSWTFDLNIRLCNGIDYIRGGEHYVLQIDIHNS